MDKKKNIVSVYTRSGLTSPSSNYRILQYKKDIPCKVRDRVIVPDKIYSGYNRSTGLKRKLFQVLFYMLAYLRGSAFLLADAICPPESIFVSRAIMPKIMGFPTKQLMEWAFRRTPKLVWDFDDNIFECGEITTAERDLLLRYASTISVIGPFLKSLVPEKCHGKVVYLPTTDGDYANVDISGLIEARKARYDAGEVGMLWLATYTGLPFLEDIIPALDRAAEWGKQQLGKQLVLEVVCNRPLQMSTTHLEIRNIVWTPKVAKERTNLAHIGLMPLRNTVHAQGKGGFKLIQYMSAGLAAIGSAVGFSNDVIAEGVTGRLVSYSDLSQWTDAVTELCASWERLAEMGLAGRKKWEEDFSYDANLKKLTKILCGEQNHENL